MQRATFAMFGRGIFPVAVLVIAASIARPCAADTETTRLAAQTYDAAVAHFERAEYVAAARLFLEADVIRPSEEALSNAIAAARRANDHLLVARAALRAQGRAEGSPELAARARQALAEAEAHLSRLELSCSPAPCELHLDGHPVPAGQHYVLPGSHRVSATRAAQSKSEMLMTDATAAYRISLDVAPPLPPTPSEPDRTSVSRQDEPQKGSGEPESIESEAVLPTEVFYISLGVTGALTGLTVWSGLDALDQKRKLEDPPSQASRDRLVASVRRTDILLASSVVMAATTAYIGWKLVNFGGGEVQVELSPSAAIKISGCF